jgi:hypothetical protein
LRRRRRLSGDRERRLLRDYDVDVDDDAERLGAGRESVQRARQRAG